MSEIKLEKMTFKKDVYVEPKFLEKYKNKILDIVTDNKFPEEYGFVISVNKKSLKIVDNYISPNTGGVFFKIEYEARVMKPKKNQEYVGKVHIILPTGIFVIVQDRIKISIPAEKMRDFSYSKSKNIFTGKNGKIKEGTLISVIVNASRYENHNFSCIGSLKGILEN